MEVKKAYLFLIIPQENYIKKGVGKSAERNIFFYTPYTKYESD
jgi:hypothetical protein